MAKRRHWGDRILDTLGIEHPDSPAVARSKALRQRLEQERLEGARAAIAAAVPSSPAPQQLALVAPHPLEILLPLRILILSPPRTKKTHGNLIDLGERCSTCGRGKRSIMVPSSEHRKWFNTVKQSVELQAPPTPITGPVNVAAIFYREKNLGDLVGFMQALADLLEAAKILENDRQIVGWDRTRMSKDAANPRIECTIERMIDRP
jgi:Holliday junction resolvase RusA-like endonuclease